METLGCVVAYHLVILAREHFMELKTIRVEIPEGVNIILGQTHFIKTADTN